MPAYPSNIPRIVVTEESAKTEDTAYISQFGARLCSNSESFYVSTSHAEGPFLSDTLDFPFQLNYSPCTQHHLAYHQTLHPTTLVSSDNSLNGAAFQLAFQQSFSADYSPASVFSDFDESSSSNYDYSATPGTSPSNHSSELGAASPHLTESFTQISLHDPASPISPSYDDALGNCLRPRRYSDIPCGNRPQVSTEAGHGRSTSHSGSHRPPFHCSNDSPIIDRMPNVGSNNGLGLTFDATYQGGATASEVGLPDGQGVRGQDIAAAGGGAPNPGRLFFADRRRSLYPHAPLLHPTMSAPRDSRAHFMPQPSRGVQELQSGDHASLRASLKLRLPTHTESWELDNSDSHCPQGMNADSGFSDGPYSAPASYTEERAPFPVEFLVRQASAPRALRPPARAANWRPDNPESCLLPSQGMDDSSGFSGGPHQEERAHISAAFLMRQASASREPRLPTHTANWGPDYPCLLLQRMDASGGFSGGPHSAPANYTGERTQFSAELQTSSPIHFRSFFEDDTRDPVRDTVLPAASSTTSGWPGETTGLPSCSKKTVSTAKLRKASAKRRKKPGRFRCTCGSTFTEKHNLDNHFNSHLGIKPFSCDRCFRGFGVASSLSRHHGTCKGPKRT